MARLALISVSDKAGVEALAQGLHALGFTLLSTGGTARVIEAAGLPVTPVSEHTGHPEIIGGRVKTLHPRVHGGVLGRRGQDDAELAALGIPWIDLVVVNLYPFEATLAGGETDPAEILEQIDIGGPTLLRAAAKNHPGVVVLVDPADYAPTLEALAEGGPDLAARRRLATKAFRHTAAYDAVIADWMERGALGASASGLRAPVTPLPELPVEGAIPLRRSAVLRYGENPHQRAAFYPDPLSTGRSLARMTQVAGPELSFNNIADLDAAVRSVFEIDDPGCVIVKHMNPCGAASHPEGAATAFRLALSCDPVSAYGGVVAFNRPVDAEVAAAIRRGRTFFEILVAPGITAEARQALSGREKLRVVELPVDWAEGRPPGFDARRVQGGWLLQDWDQGAIPGWKVATRRGPTLSEDALLRFAWAISRGTKSNAIVFAAAAEGGMVINGVGAGQMSRVDSVRLAVEKATRPVAGSVMASDAFFPFSDGVVSALAAGVTAIVQPGGSIRDEETLSVVDAAEAAMVITGMRHFRH